jgi:hypothetical protein
MKQQPIFLASYKGTHAGAAGLFNRGTRWLTRSPYSHSEICIGHPFESAVHCISSSGMDGGVRAKMMRLSPEKWDVVPLPWVSEEAVWLFMLDEKGAKYDFAGVVRFALPWLRSQSESRWFCTEAVAAIAGFDDAWRFSPGDFHKVAESVNRLMARKD